MVANHLIAAQVHHAIHGDPDTPDVEDCAEKIKAGTHRFDMHPGQVIFRVPQGDLVDRVQDRKQRMARNAAAIKLWNRRYVEVKEDGFIVRERDIPKPKLKLVQSNGA